MIDMIANKIINRNKWEKCHIGDYWYKQLDHFWTTIVDEWGVEDDENDKYKIDVYVYKIFSFNTGFGYLINAPDISITGKNYWEVFDQLMRHLYHGGCPCYYRLKEDLVAKGLFNKL